MAQKRKTIAGHAKQNPAAAITAVVAGVLVLVSAWYLLGTRAAGEITTVRFISWNLGASNPRNEGEEIVDFMRFADIMGTQELGYGAEQDTVKKYVTCSSCDFSANWTSHQYDNAYPNKILIVWRKAKYTKLDGGFVDVSPVINVNDSVSDEIPVKFISWVKLQDKATGQVFIAVNTHFVNGVERGGKPRTDVSSKRIDNYKLHMDKLASLITSLKSQNIPIFITGDFNANYRYDKTVKNSMFPYVRMGSVGARSSFDVLNLAGISSTTPDRLIDYLFTVTRSDVRVVSQKHSSSTHGSDHYGYYSTVEITKLAP